MENPQVVARLLFQLRTLLFMALGVAHVTYG